MCRLVVEPIDAGWALAIEGVANPLVYRSGRAAEEAARALAQRLAQRGGAVSLEVRLRGGAIAGRYLVQPNEVGSAAAASATLTRRPDQGSPGRN